PQPGSAARHAAENAEPDHAETVRLLEEGAAHVAASIRELADDQLGIEVATMLGTSTLAEYVERAVTFHPRWHLSSIRAALEPAGQAFRQQDRGPRRLRPVGQLGRVAQRPPAVGPPAGPEQVPAERQPVRTVHARVAAGQAEQQAGVKVVQADHVLAVVRER